jgi:pimeloyl-ACP methyl ester carboxylesterase
MNRQHERMVEVGGVDLCAETFGDRADPAILLIPGASASMDWWEEEFCERLAAGPRFVIRYDLRDTGRSVSYEPGAPPYTLRDLADDAAGLLAALGVAGAHVVGTSMGGAIAQVLALDHPDRVASLTLLSTSPSGRDPDLPEMSEETVAEFNAAAAPDWSDRAAVLDYQVHLGRVSASRSRPFDEETFRDVAARAFDRTINMASTMTNHHVMAGGDRWRERLGELDVPTLVIHGTEDPVHPYGHGRALAKEIPGATLLPLEQTGHELPRRAWEQVVPAILEHTSEP